VVKSTFEAEQAYFMVTYGDPLLTKPVVISYKFHKKEKSVSGEDVYIFSYLPAFAEDPADLNGTVVSFDQHQASALKNIAQLIDELQQIQQRLRQ